MPKRLLLLLTLALPAAAARPYDVVAYGGTAGGVIVFLAAHGAAIHDHGAAAGVAATLALESGRPLQDIDAAALTGKLRRQGAVMEYHPAPRVVVPRRAALQ